MTILGSANHQTKVQERKSLYTAQTEGKETVMISVDLLLLLMITLLITPPSSNTPQPPYHRVPMEQIGKGSKVIQEPPAGKGIAQTKIPPNR